MGHDEDLLAGGQAPELAADGFRGRARDARVDLVEDERAHAPPAARASRTTRGALLLGERRREGELDPRELAARRDLRERTGRLARVRREGERHRVDSGGPERDGLASRRERARGIGPAGDLDREGRAQEREVREVRLDGLPEPGRRRRARLREPERLLAVGRERLLRGILGLPQGAFEVGELVALPAEGGAPLDHLGERRTVLALELREGVQPLDDEREARGIGFQLLEVARGFEGDLLHRLDRTRQQRAPGRVRRGDFFE